MSGVVRRLVCAAGWRTGVVMRISVLKRVLTEYLMVVVGRVGSEDGDGKRVLSWPVLRVWVFLLVYLHLGTEVVAWALGDAEKV